MASLTMDALLDFKGIRTAKTTEKTVSLVEIAQEMRDKSIGFMLVMDGANPIGVISERDIVYKSTAESKNPAEQTVADIMTNEIIWAQTSDDISVALTKLKDGHFRHLPIRDAQNNIVGVVSERDITNFLLHKVK